MDGITEVLLQQTAVSIAETLWQRAVSRADQRCVCGKHTSGKRKTPDCVARSLLAITEEEIRGLFEEEEMCVCGEHTQEKGRTSKCLKRLVRTFTAYKTKAQKVHPIDDEPSDGSVPEGDPDWRRKKWRQALKTMKFGSKFDFFIIPRFTELIRGSRLTPERLEGLISQTTETLTKEETEIFVHMLYQREAALAWEFAHCGRLDPSVMPPQKIRTVPHKAWQVRNIPIPKPLTEKVIDLLRQRVIRGILEESHAAYRNAWFLVQKKDGGLRLINNATRFNGVTTRDAFIPPGAEDLTEEYGMCKILSLLDLFSGYDQVPLDPRSRDITTFSTPIGLLRMCTLPQGATNSVAQFLRGMVRTFYNLIPTVCRPFMDDICVKGPTTTYDEEETLPGVRRYVLEHLKNLDQVLLACELAGLTIASEKSQWCKRKTIITGYLCGTDGREPDQAKVEKLQEWNHCENTTQIKGFLGTAGFYRLWIKDFARKAEPLNRLLRKDVEWDWGEDQKQAMQVIKASLLKAPILITLDYTCGREIILVVDASLTGWGAVLKQISEDGRRHPARFESGIWNSAVQKYDATKRQGGGTRDSAGSPWEESQRRRPARCGP